MEPVILTVIGTSKVLSIVYNDVTYETLKLSLFSFFKTQALDQYKIAFSVRAFFKARLIEEMNQSSNLAEFHHMASKISSTSYVTTLFWYFSKSFSFH